MRITVPLIESVLAVILVACAEPAPEAEPTADAAPTAPCETAGRDLALHFGERLNQVSLLAPDSIRIPQIEEVYGPVVTPDLLAEWTASPGTAPGRDVSSPWPERIDVRSVESGDAGTCEVEGDVVYVTSVELESGGAAALVPVTLRMVADEGEWRIAGYEAGEPAAAEMPAGAPTLGNSATDAAGAAAVLENYYAAIDAGDFTRAYDAWGSDGAASGQSFEEFAAGYAETESVEVEIGTPGRIEGAAGSRYVEIPVTVRAVTTTGDAQRFEGAYVLRRTVVDGATPEQREWHIYSAELRTTE